jgi:predicted RNA-binding Zn-ribbon protein involved in translation (DUF1610 family)
MEFDYYSMLNKHKPEEWTDGTFTSYSVLAKNEDYVCPSCGSNDYTFNLTSKVKIYYTCKCGWEGECLISIGEWKNKTRTELIDKVLNGQR